MSKIINGKKPVSSKNEPQTASFMTDDIFGNRYQLEESLKKELDAKGLEARFVNAKTLHANQGYHPRGWKVYKRDVRDTMDTSSFLQGSDPEGIVRRGDSILAVKPKAEADKHRAILRQRANVYSQYSKRAAKQLKEHAREYGADVHVDDSYGDDDSDE